MEGHFERLEDPKFSRPTRGRRGMTISKASKNTEGLSWQHKLHIACFSKLEDAFVGPKRIKTNTSECEGPTLDCIAIEGEFPFKNGINSSK